MAAGLLLGSMVGAFAAKALPSGLLEVVFGIFEVAVGIYFLRAVNLNSGFLSPIFRSLELYNETIGVQK